MGAIGTVAAESGIKSGSGILTSLAQGGIQNWFNTLAFERESEYNSQQAEINRQFQHDEAVAAREWQEDFYNKYQSPSAMVSQYEDAGLNPALLYGSGASSPSVVSTSSPSGSSASASSSGARVGDIPAFADIFSRAMQLESQSLQNENLSATNDNIVADTELKRSQKSLNDIQSDLVSANISVQQAALVKLEEETKGTVLDNELKTIGLDKASAEDALAWINVTIAQAESYYREDILRSQRYYNESSAALNDAKSRLSDAEVAKNSIEMTKIRSEIERLEQDKEQARKRYIYDLEKASNEVLKSKGDADYSNGVGKRYNKELTHKYISDGLNLIGHVASSSAGAFVLNKSR